MLHGHYSDCCFIRLSSAAMASDTESPAGQQEGGEKPGRLLPVDMYYDYEKLYSRPSITADSEIPENLLHFLYPFHFINDSCKHRLHLLVIGVISDPVWHSWSETSVLPFLTFWWGLNTRCSHCSESSHFAQRIINRNLHCSNLGEYVLWGDCFQIHFAWSCLQIDIMLTK